MMQLQGAISEDQIAEIVAGKIQETHAMLSSMEYITGADDARVRELVLTYTEVTGKAIEDVFEQMPFTEEARVRLRELPFLFFLKNAGPQDPSSQNFSGIVLTGFGRQEIFPSLVTYAMEGRLSGILKYRELENKKISLVNGAYVIPFAQHEMVDIFMAGIDPRLANALTDSLSALFEEYPRSIVDSIESLGDEAKADLKNQIQPKSDELAGQISDYLTNYMNSNIIPVINVVISLPKTELAAMAESLVNLTSMKRKISLQAETVGGPVDVAVISRREGFVWIKRKRYPNREQKDEPVFVNR